MCSEHRDELRGSGNRRETDEDEKPAQVPEQSKATEGGVLASEGLHDLGFLIMTLKCQRTLEGT